MVMGMGVFRRWLRKTERKATGETVSLQQTDGSTATFPAQEFWLQLFCAQADAASGVVPSGPVAEAMEGAMPEARGRIERVVASGQGGDFLRGSGAEDELGLLEVADGVEDLSEA